MRPRLYLVVNAARRFKEISAGAGARDFRAIDARALEQVARALHAISGPFDGSAAVFDFTHVLCRALVCLQTCEPKIGAAGDLPRERNGRVSRFDAAAIRADIYFDKYVDRGAELLRRRVDRA